MQRKDDVIGLTLELGRVIRRAMALNMPEFGDMSPSKLHGLLLIQEREKITMKEFARMMSISASTASDLIDRWVKQGLVKRTQDSENRRQIFLTLTTKGHKVVTTNNKCKQAILTKVFSSLSASDRKELTRILSHVVSDQHL